jgi:hypothetical protein
MLAAEAYAAFGKPDRRLDSDGSELVNGSVEAVELPGEVPRCVTAVEMGIDAFYRYLW